MSKSKKWSLLLLALFGALMCYTIGFASGVFIFVALGFGLELAFWIGLFKTESRAGVSKKLM